MGITHVGRIENGWWMIKARLYYEGKTYQKELDFIIDSGAETTVLSDQDARKLGFGFDKLPNSYEAEMGGAGSCKGRPLFNAGIVFSDDEIKNHMEPCIKIYIPDPETYRTGENLIGRDILSLYDIITNNESRIITLKGVKNNYMTVP
jgi:hypothetical protein